MRREKEIAESRFEVAQGESLRHRLRVAHLERELKEAQDTLNSEREKMKVSRSAAPGTGGRRGRPRLSSVCVDVSVCGVAVLRSWPYLSPPSQVTAKTLDQHNELMKKTETMSVLMESNKLLREDRDRMQQELEQNQAKVPQLAPDRTRLRYPN